MIEFGLFGIIGLCILVFLQVLLVKKRMIQKIDVIAGMVFTIYSLVLIKIVFFPIPFQEKSIALFREINGNFSMNLIPLKSMLEIVITNDAGNIFYQLGGNFLLLLPMGLYLSIIFRKTSFKKLVLSIALTSAFIEMVQFLIGFAIDCQYRVVDIDDVILNILGGLVGLVIGRLIYPLYKRACEIILS